MKGRDRLSKNKANQARAGVGFVAGASLGASVITLCSWISVPSVPPITLQLFGVFVCSGLLGLRRGAASCLVWIALGALGLPVFAGFGGGLGTLLGPSGGYIVGLLLASLIVGFASELSDAIAPMLLSMLAALLLIYVCGAAWYRFSYAEGASFYDILVACVLPFVAWDALKLALAVTVTKRLKRYLRGNAR